MTKILMFGGTTEGRRLCESCPGQPILYCAATEDGARAVAHLPHVTARAGRLDADGIGLLLRETVPLLVVDATHPYAAAVSANIRIAAGNARIPLIRVLREPAAEKGCAAFTDTASLLVWLERQEGNIFVAAGSSCAEPFTRLQGYETRIWMRILPSVESMRICLALGYRPDRLICMQGPFSEELNRAMFREAGARILVTKNSGTEGGFPEKLRAASSLGIRTAVLKKPEEAGGVSLEEAQKRMRELGI